MPQVTSVVRIRAETVTRFSVPNDAVRVVVALYRICPLGAHIDHQLGPVTAMAIDQAVNLAFAPSESRHVRLVMEEILAICQRYNVSFGTAASGSDAAQRWIKKGVRFFEAIDELLLISEGASRLVKQYREAELAR